MSAHLEVRNLLALLVLYWYKSTHTDAAAAEGGETRRREEDAEREWRVLTYAHVCSRMLTYAHVCSRMLKRGRRRMRREWRMLTYAHVCRHMLTEGGGDGGRDEDAERVTYADVCWRMLTYAADVCWRMLTEGGGDAAEGWGGCGESYKYWGCQVLSLPKFTCFTSTKVSICTFVLVKQIINIKAARCIAHVLLLSLLALLVQTYLLC
jgi:hypothetical protein